MSKEGGILEKVGSEIKKHGPLILGGIGIIELLSGKAVVGAILGGLGLAWHLSRGKESGASHSLNMSSERGSRRAFLSSFSRLVQ